jgi:hypothetical protein
MAGPCEGEQFEIDEVELGTSAIQFRGRITSWKVKLER